jgi:hypothetical protein
MKIENMNVANIGSLRDLKADDHDCRFLAGTYQQRVDHDNLPNAVFYCCSRRAETAESDAVGRRISKRV